MRKDQVSQDMADGLREIAEKAQGSALRSTHAYLKRRVLRVGVALRKTVQVRAAALNADLQRLIKIGKDKGGRVVAKFKTSIAPTPPVADKFKIGDKVVPLSGSPEMIVLGFERDIPNGPVIMVQCVGKNEKTERWHVNSLKIVPPIQTSASPPVAPSASPKTPA